MNWGDIKEACKRLDDHLTDGVYAHGRHLAGLDRSAAPPSRRAAAIQRLDFAAPRPGCDALRAARARAR